MTAYNGHESWDHWNVSLWLSSDESLYNLLCTCVKTSSKLDRAATETLEALQDLGLTQTPDGAVFTQTNVEAAIAEKHAEYWSNEDA